MERNLPGRGHGVAVVNPGRSARLILVDAGTGQSVEIIGGELVQGSARADQQSNNDLRRRRGGHLPAVSLILGCGHEPGDVSLQHCAYDIAAEAAELPRDRVVVAGLQPPGQDQEAQQRPQRRARCKLIRQQGIGRTPGLRKAGDRPTPCLRKAGDGNQRGWS